MQLIFQGPEKASPYLPSWRVIAAGGHDRDVTPSTLPHPLVCNAPVEVIARVGMYPVPIDLLESEDFRGRGVNRNIYLLPIPVL